MWLLGSLAGVVLVILLDVVIDRPRRSRTGSPSRQHRGPSTQ